MTQQTESGRDVGDPREQWREYQGVPTGADIECRGLQRETTLRLLNDNGFVAEKARRAFTTDPGMGVVRHADAGYGPAIEQADASGLPIPMRDRS